MILSYGYNQDEIIDNIIELHCKHYIDCDPTYGNGGFYKKRPRPKFCSDLYPKFNYVVKADCRDLPLKSESVNTLILDGPFGIGQGPSTKKKIDGQNIIIQRFGSFKSGKELFDFYIDAIDEANRVLKIGGILIQKIQPVVGSGRQWMTHILSSSHAQNLGFFHLDEFILLRKNVLVSGKWKTQRHARKGHCYFYVFRKD